MALGLCLFHKMCALLHCVHKAKARAAFIVFACLIFSALMQLRKENQDAFTKRHGIKLGFMSAFVKASAYALTLQPTVNAVIEGQEIIYRDYVDISVAVATPKVSQVQTRDSVLFDLRFNPDSISIRLPREKLSRNVLFVHVCNP